MSTLKVPLRNGNGSNDMYGGRTNSQTSIYDYPEHLNPFYEDENHKRIRFWHIGKSKNHNDNGSRRGSFSLSGFKEMWGFKSLRLSKKRSSNLGINKTSESPPPIRRIPVVTSDENHYGTYDPRMRHTIGNNMMDNKNFLRNVPYRASLQDMRSVHKVEYNNNKDNGFDFERNNRYRSTIQTTQRRSDGLSSPKTPPRRYVYGGSITPQPRLRSNDFDDDCSGISRGSSQVSITSKNPFEEDHNDNDDVVIGKISESGEKRKRYVRKKRRAPLPPIPIPKIIDEESQTSTSPDCSQNKIGEENLEIKNLADEIENFVNSANNNPEENSTENPKWNDDDNVSEDPYKYLSESEKEQQKEKVIISDQYLSLVEKCDDQEGIGNIEINVKNSRNQDNVEGEHKKILEKKICTSNVDEKEINVFYNKHNSYNKYNSNENKNQKSMDAINCLEVELNNEQTIELKITESVEDLSERSQKSETSNKIVNELEYVSLNIEPKLDESEEKEKVEVKEIYVDSNNKIYDYSTSYKNEEKQKQATPNRRRSVREIIESINRSQKLLNINQQNLLSNLNEEDSRNFGCEQFNVDVKNNVIKAPPRKKHDSKMDKQQLSDITDEIHMEENSAQTVNNYDILLNQVNDNNDQDEDNNDRNEKECEIFKKCEISKKPINRETSPISSNLDWNPVPKPKRTKKLTIELQKCDQMN